MVSMPYKIKTVSEMTGIPKNTLIAWERRYGQPAPERTPSGYRVYSDDDVALLGRIQELRAQGYRISEALDLVGHDPPRTKPSASGLDGIREALLEALLRYDLNQAEALSRAVLTVPYASRIDELLLPMVQEVGHRWQVGTVSVVQEHLVSGWARERLLAMMRSQEPRGPGAPEAVCATLPGERHEFGLLGAAFHLAQAGFRVVYLGCDVPLAQLRAVLVDRRPDVMALSAVLERPDVDLLTRAGELADCLPKGRILVGGRAAEALISTHPRVLIRTTAKDTPRKISGSAARG